MDTNNEKLLAKEEVFQIVGCAIEVLNTLGHGLLEKSYENALAVEFGMRNIPFRQQPLFDVLYKGQKVGLCINHDTFECDQVVDKKTDLLSFVKDIEQRLLAEWNVSHTKLNC